MKGPIKKEVLRRMRIIDGHLKKVVKMIEEDKYCIDILQQSLAVESALKEVDSLILDQHIRSCVVEAMQRKNGRKEKSIKELLKVFQLSRK